MQDTRISEQQNDDFITIAEAGHWATVFLGKQVSASNISYLIQYGRINKFINHRSRNVPILLKEKCVIRYEHL